MTAVEKKHTILIVDDEKDSVDCLAKWFSCAQFEICSASDGLEALKLVESKKPDLIILDIVMPNMDGFEVAKRLKGSDQYRSIPIIMLTAKHDCRHKVEGFNLGVDDYVTKPFDFDEVDARIKAMIRKRALYLELEKKNQQLDQTNLKLKDLSLTDEKTTLFNYRYFHSKLREEFRRAKRYETSLSIIMVDLDNFKAVNDTHGHRIGDVMLKEVAKILHSNARETDFVTRYGGEEFAAILPNSNAAMAKQVSERMRKAVDDHIFTEKSLPMTISAGIATFPDSKEIDGPDGLVHAADAALYMAKKKGKNRTEIDGGSYELSVPGERGTERMKEEKI